MADGVVLNAGSGGATIATDTISNKDYQRIKLIHGADGTNDGDISSAGGLPVNAGLQSNTIYNGTTQMTPVFARVALTVDANIVAAQTGKIRVLAMTVNVDTANDDLDVEDGSGGTNLWKFVNIPLGVSVLPFNPAGWFETAEATALWGNITLAGTSVNVAVVYVDVV